MISDRDIQEAADFLSFLDTDGLQRAIDSISALARPRGEVSGEAKKVCVGVPSGDMVHMDFALCLIRMLLSKQNQDAFLINERQSLLPSSRQALADSAIKEGATHLLFLDSDMVFPPDLISRLMAHGKDLVAVPCTTRKFPLSTNVTGSDNVRIFPIPNELFKAARVGTAFMLISLERLAKMPRPWFGVEYNKETEKFKGEDFFFCDMWRENGGEVWCDGTLTPEVRHLGQYDYGVKDFKVKTRSTAEELNGIVK